MRIFLFFMIIIAVGCSFPNRSGFPAGNIKNVSLSRNVPTGSYATKICKEEYSDGKITIQRNIVFLETFWFCIDEQYAHSRYVLEIEKDKKKMCRFESTGYCGEDGMCESISVREQCHEFGT